MSLDCPSAGSAKVVAVTPAGVPGSETAPKLEPVLLSINDAVKEYGRALTLLGRSRPVQAVAGVSLALRRAEIVGLLGESGCGKSTLARLSAGLDQPTRGRVEYLGIDTRRLTNDRVFRRQFRADVQIVFQDAISSLNPRLTVFESIAEGLRIRGQGGFKANQDRVIDVMHRVKLSTDSGGRFPTQLSGGQLQRVASARSLLLDPKLLIADEPVSSLDLLVQGEVLNLLLDFRETSALGILFVTHNLAVANQLCDRIAVMYLGKIVEFAVASELYARPLHPYTVALLSAVPQVSLGRDKKVGRIILQGDPPDAARPPSGCRFRTRCPVAQPVCADLEPALTERVQGHEVACHFPGALKAHL